MSDFKFLGINNTGPFRLNLQVKNVSGETLTDVTLECDEDRRQWDTVAPDQVIHVQRPVVGFDMRGLGETVYLRVSHERDGESVWQDWPVKRIKG